MIEDKNDRNTASKSKITPMINITNEILNYNQISDPRTPPCANNDMYSEGGGLLIGGND